MRLLFIRFLILSTCENQWQSPCVIFPITIIFIRQVSRRIWATAIDLVSDSYYFNKVLLCPQCGILKALQNFQAFQISPPPPPVSIPVVAHPICTYIHTRILDHGPLISQTNLVLSVPLSVKRLSGSCASKTNEPYV